MNRWCPSCRKPWPADRAACPDCLVELVDDPDATVVCRHCGRRWPARMQSCPNCLAELRPDPAAAVEALVDILGAGGHLPRPDGVAPFRNGPSCSLVRLTGRGPLVFLGADELVEAEVTGGDRRVRPPLACRDVEGAVLFRLQRYEAAADAVVAIDVDGAPLGTFLRDGHAVDVRDATSAPVAALRRGVEGFRLVETGGGVLAEVEAVDTELDGWIDDQWSLQPRVADDDLPLAPLAAVAMVLAAKVLLGRPFPVPAGERSEPPAFLLE